MQMVEHQMIYSPERKKTTIVTWQHRAKNHLLQRYTVWWISNLLTLLTADLPASCPKWVLPSLFSCLPISAGFQLTLFFSNWVGLALHLSPPPPLRPVPGSSGSRQLPVFLSGTTMIFACLHRCRILSISNRSIEVVWVKNPHNHYICMVPHQDLCCRNLCNIGILEFSFCRN